MANKAMTNLEIYAYANALRDAFKEDIMLPVRVNFYLQKNMTKLTEAAKEIEKARMEIIEKHGTPAEDGNGFQVSAEKVEIVNKELEDLFNLEQEIKVNEITLDAFNDIELTSSQVAAISFMIKDEEE